jgi:hypothetical protein
MQAAPSAEFPWVVVLLPIMGLLGIFGLVWFMGFASGLGDLAKAFPNKPAMVIRSKVGSIWLDQTSMSSVTIWTSAEGVHLSPNFQFGSATACIPWSELHERYDESTVFGSRVHFAVGTPRRWHLILPGEVFAPPPVPRAVDRTSAS